MLWFWAGPDRLQWILINWRLFVSNSHVMCINHNVGLLALLPFQPPSAHPWLPLRSADGQGSVFQTRPGQIFVQKRWDIFWNCNILEYWFLPRLMKYLHRAARNSVAWLEYMSVTDSSKCVVFLFVSHAAAIKIVVFVVIKMAFSSQLY